MNEKDKNTGKLWRCWDEPCKNDEIIMVIVA